MTSHLTEAHEPPLGLVRDAIAAQLEDDRVPDGAGRGHGVRYVRHHVFCREGHTEAAQQLLRPRFGESGHGGPQ